MNEMKLMGRAQLRVCTYDPGFHSFWSFADWLMGKNLLMGEAEMSPLLAGQAPLRRKAASGRHDVMLSHFLVISTAAERSGEISASPIKWFFRSAVEKSPASLMMVETPRQSSG